MPAGFFPRDELFMRLAIREAERALEHDDVPIGAVVVHEGEVIGVGRVVYGTPDPKAGAAGSVLDVLAEPRFNHRPEVAGGVLREACAALLVDFFAARR